MKSNKRGSYHQQKRPTTNKEPCFVASYGTLSFPGNPPLKLKQNISARQTCLDLLQMVMVMNHMGSQSVKNHQTSKSKGKQQNHSKPNQTAKLWFFEALPRCISQERPFCYSQETCSHTQCHLWSALQSGSFFRHPGWRLKTPRWASEKKPGAPYFPWNPGWFIGILIIAYITIPT